MPGILLYSDLKLLSGMVKSSGGYQQPVCAVSEVFTGLILRDNPQGNDISNALLSVMLCGECLGNHRLAQLVS